MSTSILPDDSVVVRLPDRTVHVDATEHLVRVRATYARRTLGGSVLAAYDFGQIRRLRVAPRSEGGVSLQLELKSGRVLSLGAAPSAEVAMLTGRAVADVCRCQLEAGHGSTELPTPSARFSEGNTFLEGLEATGAVVPLLAGPEPASLGTAADPEHITDERPHPRRAPARAGSLYRVTRELKRKDIPTDSGPVFGALLRESELASALDPRDLSQALAGSEGPASTAPVTEAPAPGAPDENPTQVGIASLGRRPAAVAELLNLAAERLPLALPELPNLARKRGRSRLR